MSTKDLVYIALFAAITAALAIFPPFVLPVIGVPITAQSMGPMLAGSILGARRGALAILLFLVLVAVGLPLLSGGRGGLAIFLGPGGGFLLSWPLGALVVGWLCQRYWSTLTFWRAALFNLIGGVAVIYPPGILWIRVAADLSLVQAAAGTVAFLPGDFIKVVIAALVAVTVKRAYPLISTAQKA